MFIAEEGEHLYKYYKDKEDKLLEIHSLLKDSPAEKHFHQFRVSIKKIRSIFQLLELMACDFYSTKYLNPLRSIFKPAGNVREWQINLKTIENYNMLTSEKKALYQSYCHSKISKARTKFSEKLKEFNTGLIRKNGKEVKNCCTTLTQGDIFGKAIIFIQNRLDIIKDNLEDTSDEFMIHQVRTKLKEINAVIHILIKTRVEGFNDNLVSLIRKSEIELGNWHDKVILYNSIEKFLKNNTLDSNTKHAFKEVKNSINSENQQFLDTLESKVLHTINTVQLTTKAVSNSL